jgi:hypothetical protein
LALHLFRVTKAQNFSRVDLGYWFQMDSWRNLPIVSGESTGGFRTVVVFTSVSCTWKKSVPPATENQPADIQGAVEFAITRLQFEPDERQMEVLASTAERGILNCTRQWGKSTVMAAKAVHRAYTRAESLVVLASPSERQSGEWMLKAEQMVGRLGIRAKGDGVNKLSLVLPNGSRLVGLPDNEDKIRGLSKVSLLLIDEAGRVTESLYRSLMPMLAVGNGDMWLMSTPCGKRGFFYETWEYGGDRWFRVRVPATECSRIPKGFLEEQRSTMGMQWFRQEYMCEFVDGTGAVFGRDLVEAAVDDSIEPLEV